MARAKVREEKIKGTFEPNFKGSRSSSKRRDSGKRNWTVKATAEFGAGEVVAGERGKSQYVKGTGA